MLLAIDAGNTNIVFAIYEGEALKGYWRASTNARRTADEYAVWFTQLMALAGLSPAAIDACIVSCVVPDALLALTRLSERYFGVTAAVIGETALDLGIRALLPRPEEVGADRLVNAVAAKSLARPPLIVVDFGTATTFDVVDAAGDYVGGVIAPGINLSLDALAQAAAQLPRVAVRPARKVIGDGTIAAMQSGIYWGYVGLIEGLVERIEGEFGQPMQVVTTGGLATLFAGATTAIGRIEPELTLLGLRIIHERNRRA